MEFHVDIVRARAEGPLRAVLPIESTDRFDPFLILHEQGPVIYRPGEAIGFCYHPHAVSRPSTISSTANNTTAIRAAARASSVQAVCSG